MENILSLIFILREEAFPLWGFLEYFIMEIQQVLDGIIGFRALLEIGY